MRLGFTGTQRGITDAQAYALCDIFSSELVDGIDHGDCIGADEDAHQIAGYFFLSVTIHPPLIDAKRAFCEGAELIMPPKPYLERNKDIVQATKALVATPGEAEEQVRSGTWSTVRYARALAVRSA